MTSTLLDANSEARLDKEGHLVRINHVETPFGTPTVRTESQHEDYQEWWGIIGGLGANGSYERLACDIAGTGAAASTVRHDNNGSDDVFDKDAGEAAGVIQEFGEDKEVNLLGQSKGGLVVALAAIELPEHIKVKKIVLLNDAMDASPAHLAGNPLKIGAELLLATAVHPLRMSHVFSASLQELVDRPQALFHEWWSMLFNPDISQRAHRAIQQLQDMGVEVIWATGERDQVLGRKHQQQVGNTHEFDKKIEIKGPVAGSHYGSMLVRGFAGRLGLKRAS